mgnify:CR=1 FL=1
MKILNLYAGIGGNRKLWPKEHEITAVEINPEIAKIYQDNFPDDKVIVADAHKYLLEHYKEFDFIWSSPPCPTHSRTNIYLNSQGIIRYPDMKLWQEIIFLNRFFKGKWVVENVISYYEPLDLCIKPQESERHYFWCNFIITKRPYNNDRWNLTNCRASSRLTNGEWRKKLQEKHGFEVDFKKLKMEHPEKVLTNCVNPKLSLHIFNMAFKEKQQILNGLSNFTFRAK